MKSTIINIACPILEILNCSFQTEIFIENLKIATVCPVFNSGEKYNISNYRPVSLLSFSKILEKIVHNRLSSFLASNNVISDNQYEFSLNNFTYMALMNMCKKS